MIRIIKAKRGNLCVRNLVLATLAASIAACGLQPALEVEMATQVSTLDDVMKCQYVGYTKAGITEKNEKTTETEGSDSVVDDRLLTTIRNLANDIGADTVVPVYETGDTVSEFRLYICKEKN